MTALDSTAMHMGTWETLKVHPGRGLLAAVGTSVPPGVGALAMDVYDVKSDCAHPRLLNGLAGTLTVPAAVFGHEAEWSPDGKTYYVMPGTGVVQAIDMSNPARPRTIAAQSVGATNHGVSISPDGRTMYGVTTVPAGVQILDISDIQDRKPIPQIRQIGAVSWSDGVVSQQTLNFTRGGHPYLYAVDEGAGGGVRLIDIADPTKPSVVREYRLGINRPANAQIAAADTGGDGAFGYDAHYCTLDRRVDPTRLACGYFQSGVRLFDVRDPMAPRELGYYNPPAQVGREAGTAHALVNSAHAWSVFAPDVMDPAMYGGAMVMGSLHPTMTTDWCSSPPQFEPDDTLWVTCQDNGFMVLKYRPASASAPVPVPAPVPAASSASSDNSDSDSDSHSDSGSDESDSDGGDHDWGSASSANGHRSAEPVPVALDSGALGNGGPLPLVFVLGGFGLLALGGLAAWRRWQ